MGVRYEIKRPNLKNINVYGKQHYSGTLFLSELGQKLSTSC